MLVCTTRNETDAVPERSGVYGPEALFGNVSPSCEHGLVSMMVSPKLVCWRKTDLERGCDGGVA